MEKITYENEDYYFNKGILYDSTFIEVPKNVSQKVLKEHYEKINYEEFDEASLLEHLNYLKISVTIVAYKRLTSA